jgi:hypothetical protein
MLPHRSWTRVRDTRVTARDQHFGAPVENLRRTASRAPQRLWPHRRPPTGESGRGDARGVRRARRQGVRRTLLARTTRSLERGDRHDNHGTPPREPRAVASAAVPSSAPPRDDEYRPDPDRWKALAVVLAAGFMTLLDVSIVNVALPSIAQGLHARPSELLREHRQVRALPAYDDGRGPDRADRRAPAWASRAVHAHQYPVDRDNHGRTAGHRARLRRPTDRLDERPAARRGRTAADRRAAAAAPVHRPGDDGRHTRSIRRRARQRRGRDGTGARVHRVRVLSGLQRLQRPLGVRHGLHPPAVDQPGRCGSHSGW